MNIKEIIYEGWKTGAALGAGIGSLGGVPGALAGGIIGGLIGNFIQEIKQSTNNPLYQSSLKKLLDIITPNFDDIKNDTRVYSNIEALKKNIEKIAYNTQYSKEEKIATINRFLENFKEQLNQLRTQIDYEKSERSQFDQFFEQCQKWLNYKNDFYRWYLAKSGTYSDAPGPGLSFDDGEYINYKKLRYLNQINKKFDDLINDKVMYTPGSYKVRFKILKQLVKNFKETLDNINWDDENIINPPPALPQD